MTKNSTTRGRAVAYLRVSTDKQVDSGLGLDAQRASVKAAAQRLALTLSSTFVDAGASGSLSLENRSVLMEAVSALKRGDVLLVAKRDRLGRDVVEVALIERFVTKRGARVISAAGEGTDSDDPAGVLMRRLIDSFAEYERLIIAARTRAALAAKRRRRERVSGAIPYGYALGRDGRALEPVTEEQRTLQTVRELRHRGRSFQAIADALNDQGSFTRAGGRWRWQYVCNLVQRPGRAAYDDTYDRPVVGDDAAR